MPRGGARAGDAIWIAGPVGLAAAGRHLLERGAPPRSPAEVRADRAFRRPIARLRAGLLARAIARAAIDVSDGLARDLGHVARTSGVRAVLDPATLLSPELVEIGATLGLDPLELALHGGEDYALIVVASASARLEGFVRVGGCEPRGDETHDVALVAPDGSQRPVTERGFDHFTR
jgi:thiamine-monophosphate kinase